MWFVPATATVTAPAAGSPVTLAGLTTERRTNPVGLDAARPRSGWRLVSATDGRLQDRYQATVGTAREPRTSGTTSRWRPARAWTSGTAAPRSPATARTTGRSGSGTPRAASHHCGRDRAAAGGREHRRDRREQQPGFDDTARPPAKVTAAPGAGTRGAQVAVPNPTPASGAAAVTAPAEAVPQGYRNGAASYSLASGSYTFTAR